MTFPPTPGCACALLLLLPRPAVAARESAPPPADLTSDLGFEAPRGVGKDGGEGRLAWMTLSPRIGYGAFGEGTAESDGVAYTIGARTAKIVALGVDLGGTGLGLDLAPFFALEEGTLTVPDPGQLAWQAAWDAARGLPEEQRTAAADAARDAARQLIGWTPEGREVTYTVLGVYLGTSYKIQASRSFYPYVGGGLRAGLLFAEEIDAGAEIYWRGLVGLCAYLGEDMAVNVEFGAGSGATGIKGLQAQELSFGSTSLWDLSVGLRFP